MKKYFKKNKFKIIIAVSLILIILFAAIGMVKLLYPDSSVSFYGNRLDDIEKVQIESDKFNKINALAKESDFVIDSKSYLTGRVLKVVLTIQKDIDLIKSEGIADKILTLFSDEEKAYYDFEIMLNTEEETELYPLIGYKSKNSVNFKWVNS